MMDSFRAFWRIGATMRIIAICVVLLMPAIVAQATHAATTTAAHPAAAQSNAPSNLAANQFSSEQTAKGHCPSDTVVWVNLSGSKAYHVSGDRYYGKTKHGAFMCQKDADQSGFHAAGSRAHSTATKSTAPKTSH
jgi:hypothetical protein